MSLVAERCVAEATLKVRSSVMIRLLKWGHLRLHSHGPSRKHAPFDRLTYHFAISFRE